MMILIDKSVLNISAPDNYNRNFIGSILEIKEKLHLSRLKLNDPRADRLLGLPHGIRDYHNIIDSHNSASNRHTNM